MIVHGDVEQFYVPRINTGKLWSWKVFTPVSPMISQDHNKLHSRMIAHSIHKSIHKEGLSQVA